MSFSSEQVYTLSLGSTALDTGIPGEDSVKRCAQAFANDMSIGIPIPTPDGGGMDLKQLLDLKNFGGEGGLPNDMSPAAQSLRQEAERRFGTLDKAKAFAADAYTKLFPDFEGSRAEQCVQAVLADSATYGCLAVVTAAAGSSAAANPAVQFGCSKAAKFLAKYTWGATVAAVNYGCEKLGAGICDEISGQYKQLFDSRGTGYVWAAEWALPPIAIYRGIAEAKKLFGACNKPNWNGLAAETVAKAAAMRELLIASLCNSWYGMRSALEKPLPDRPPNQGDFMPLTPQAWIDIGRPGGLWPPLPRVDFCEAENNEASACRARPHQPSEGTYPCNVQDAVLRGCQARNSGKDPLPENQAAQIDQATFDTLHRPYNPVIAAMLDGYARMSGMVSLDPRQLTAGDKALDLIVIWGEWPSVQQFVMNTYDWPTCPSDADMEDFNRLAKLAIDAVIVQPYNLAYAAVLADMRSAIAAESTGLCVGSSATQPCQPMVQGGSCEAGWLWNAGKNACEKVASVPALDGQCQGSYKFLQSGRCYRTEAEWSAAYLKRQAEISASTCRPGLTGTFPNCQVPNCPPMTRSTTGITPQCMPINLIKMPALRASTSTVAPALTSLLRKAQMSSLVSSMSKVPALRTTVAAPVTQAMRKANMASMATSISKMPSFLAKTQPLPLSIQPKPKSKLPMFLLGGAILAILGYVIYEETK